LKISEPIGRGTQNNDCDRERGKILLKGKISIDGHEYIELLCGEGKQFTVLYGRPSHLTCRLDVVTDNLA
jgi:hypothetical protein